MHTAFSQTLHGEAVRLNIGKLKTWPSAEVSAPNIQKVTHSDLLKSTREIMEGWRDALAELPHQTSEHRICLHICLHIQ